MNHTLIPLQDEGTTRDNSPKILLLTGKDFLQKVKDNEVNLSLV